MSSRTSGLPLALSTYAMPVSYRTLTTVLVIVIVCAAVVGILVPAGLGWDFACFYDAGRKAWAGQIADLYDPLAPIQGQAPQGQMAFWGVPLSSYFYAPLAPLPPSLALIVFKIQNTVALFAALFLLYRQMREMVTGSPAEREWFAAAFAFLVLIYQPFWTIYRVGGQTTPTVLLLLVIALRFHSRSWFAGSALCVTLAIMIKPAFASLLVLLLFVSGARFCVASALLGSLLFGLSVALMGWDVHQVFLERMRTGAQNSTVWVHNSGFLVALENLRLLTNPAPTAPGRPLMASVAMTAIRVLVMLYFVRLYLTARRQAWSQPARLHCYFVLALVLTLLLAPTVWEHYLALLFIPLAYIVAAARYFSVAARAIVAAIFCFALGQNLILINWVNAHLVLDTVVEVIVVGLFKSAPLLLTLILLWRHSHELFASYTAPAWRPLR